jgi:excinuclease ABC subunit B
MYADELTESMEKAIHETNRRRKLQEEYNLEHGITPKTIQKSVRDSIKATVVEDIHSKYDINKDASIEEIINQLTDEMLSFATQMQFEKAAELRDKIKELESLL